MGGKNKIRHEPKSCKNCGNSFIPIRISQDFCERQCAIDFYSHYKHIKKFFKKKCKCGKIFLSKNIDAKLCEKCSERIRGVVICVVCGKKTILSDTYPYKKGFACYNHPDVWRAYCFAIRKENVG